jgi:alkanesulfonate monooxygenase SsuD/methylene tetrahydromethanopterin reductase-like flavin-dependent oxidoreductase (luciferase family)
MGRSCVVGRARADMNAPKLEIIGTCPAFGGAWDLQIYTDRLKRSVRLAEASGWTSVLVYADHRQLDPWLLAQLVVQSTEHLVWLRPYQTGRSSCPFLVGSFGDVAREIEAYARAGISTFLLEAPSGEEDAAAINQHSY